MKVRRQGRWLAVLFGMLACLFFTPAAHAAAPATASAPSTAAEQSAEEVMQQFATDVEVSPQRKIETRRKHQILFMMGIALLVLLLLTGGFGLSMVVFEKDVFVPHMIFAGLSLTLAIVHAATSIAWFWPY